MATIEVITIASDCIKNSGPLTVKSKPSLLIKLKVNPTITNIIPAIPATPKPGITKIAVLLSSI